MTQCKSGKVSYPSRGRALGAALRFATKYGSSNRAYKCNLCKKYHVTTKPLRERSGGD